MYWRNFGLVCTMYMHVLLLAGLTVPEHVLHIIINLYVETKHSKTKTDFKNVNHISFKSTQFITIYFRLDVTFDAQNIPLKVILRYRRRFLLHDE